MGRRIDDRSDDRPLRRCGRRFCGDLLARGRRVAGGKGVHDYGLPGARRPDRHGQRGCLPRRARGREAIDRRLPQRARGRDLHRRGRERRALRSPGPAAPRPCAPGVDPDGGSSSAREGKRRARQATPRRPRTRAARYSTSRTRPRPQPTAAPTRRGPYSGGPSGERESTSTKAPGPRRQRRKPGKSLNDQATDRSPYSSCAWRLATRQQPQTLLRRKRAGMPTTYRRARKTPLQPSRMAHGERARRPRRRAPARPALTAAAGVQPQPRNHHEHVVAVRVDADPPSGAGHAPAHEAGRVERRGQPADAAQRVGRRARAVVGVVLPAGVPAAVAVALVWRRLPARMARFTAAGAPAGARALPFGSRRAAPDDPGGAGAGSGGSAGWPGLLPPVPVPVDDDGPG